MCGRGIIKFADTCQSLQRPSGELPNPAEVGRWGRKKEVAYSCAQTLYLLTPPVQRRN